VLKSRESITGHTRLYRTGYLNERTLLIIDRHVSRVEPHRLEPPPGAHNEGRFEIKCDKQEVKNGTKNKTSESAHSQ
jgi:hypothetical protein